MFSKMIKNLVKYYFAPACSETLYQPSQGQTLLFNTVSEAEAKYVNERLSLPSLLTFQTLHQAVKACPGQTRSFSSDTEKKGL
jgi:hypothetical protein